MHRIPVRRESDDELCAIIREDGGMGVARNKERHQPDEESSVIHA
jgi:hypothetical protein